MHFNLLTAFAMSVATLALAVAGCGSDDANRVSTEKPPPADTRAKASAPPIDDALLGTYERRVTRDDIERTDKIRNEAGPRQEKPAPGPARLVISASSLTFTELGVKPPFTIEQSITTSADRLSLESYVRPDKGSFCGPEIPQNASYRWAPEGADLRLTASGDPCADRDSILTGTWKSQP